jgi:hypothetical protein
VSAIRLATVVAALHVAVLAGRLSVRCPRGRHAAMLVWQVPDSAAVESAHDRPRVPSNPTQNYNAGRLALTVGMAIIARIFQLQVMRMGAALSR